MAVTVNGSHPQPVEQGATVTLTCTWDQGNPPRTVAFFDEGGRELVSKVIASGDRIQIVHVVEKARCQNSGVFRCEATGSGVGRSATLLVQCE